MFLDRHSQGFHLQSQLQLYLVTLQTWLCSAVSVALRQAQDGECATFSAIYWHGIRSASERDIEAL
jgi:hypothetical protein